MDFVLFPIIVLLNQKRSEMPSDSLPVSDFLRIKIDHLIPAMATAMNCHTSVDEVVISLNRDASS